MVEQYRDLLLAEVNRRIEHTKQLINDAEYASSYYWGLRGALNSLFIERSNVITFYEETVKENA